MSRKLFFLLGLLTGALLIELFYRPLKARLQVAEAAEAERQRFNEFLEREQQEYYESLPIEKKIDYTIAMAADWEEEDDETEE